ncbi:hypothetical protein NA57DRAFT_65501 [Rhizodiscina lignyota]|uniref:Exonuclease domain-containing protein n=1 Tax=Rhizodiscina lignyota TaxID=1504668 RepID=A0A9P4IJ38_9PEZI|nr:hypothetical protein NA57DRAFT_65501 [Rhizodiscina lignyota]
MGRRKRHIEDEGSVVVRTDFSIVESRATKRRKKKDHGHNNYPEISHSSSARLQSYVKISDLQALVLYVFAQGPSPQWVAVRHASAIQKVVVLMAPGLELGMFNGTLSLDSQEPHGKKSSELESDLSPKQSFDNGATNTISAGEQNDSSKAPLSPDDYYPTKLDADKLPEVLKPLADMFSHVWPIKAPGDDKYSRLFSPLQAMLTAPLPKSKEERKMKGAQPPREAKTWQNQRTSITEFIANSDELRENEYVLHPALFPTGAARAKELELRQKAKQSTDDGWVDTKIEELEEGVVPFSEQEDGSITGGREVLAMDCEMCKTDTEAAELTRISILGWDGSVILDELVKPERPIVDYLTQYSGITKEMLEPVTTTLRDIQEQLLKLITPRTILVGHSLNSDLTALKMTHPFIVDTSIIFPHPRGPPLKSSLKFLAQKYLSRGIQKHHGTTGHDSVEDARAVLDLVKQKCEKGPKWGTSEASGEPIFKRLGRVRRPGPSEAYRTGAVVDWGDPKRGHGSTAEVSIGCENDDQVVEGVKSAIFTARAAPAPFDPAKYVPEVDFVWARLRELEAIRGWWNTSKSADVDQLRSDAIANSSHDENVDTTKEVSKSDLSSAVARTVDRIKAIYAGLPKCTAFVVYTGTGDPRETSRLQALQQQFRKEYQIKKWDELSVKWTDVEEQELRRAVREARAGLGFVVVK